MKDGEFVRQLSRSETKTGGLSKTPTSMDKRVSSYTKLRKDSDRFIGNSN